MTGEVCNHDPFRLDALTKSGRCSNCRFRNWLFPPRKFGSPAVLRPGSGSDFLLLTVDQDWPVARRIAPIARKGPRLYDTGVEAAKSPWGPWQMC